MIRLDRKIAKIIPYRTIFFPTEETVHRVLSQAAIPHLLRLFWTDIEAEITPKILRHERTATVRLDLTRPLGETFQNIAKSGRYDIRQAEKLTDRVSITRNESRFADDFLALYNSFAKSKGEISSIKKESFERYREHADNFLAYYDNRPMCGHVLLRDEAGGRARLLFSASRRLEERDAARICGLLNRFLHWHEICFYRDQGFALYDFGGIREDSIDGISRFKLSFGGERVAEHTYLCANTPMLMRSALLIFAVLRARSTSFRRTGITASIYDKHSN